MSAYASTLPEIIAVKVPAGVTSYLSTWAISTENRSAMSDADKMDRIRARNRERARAYRERRRRGGIWAWIAIGPSALAGLERLALLPVGDRSLEAVSEAVAQFVHAAAPLAAVGDALWPEPRR